MATNINSITTEELEAELEKRKRPSHVNELMKLHKDLTHAQKAERYEQLFNRMATLMRDLANEERCKDYRYYVYEDVCELVFGSGCFEHINAITEYRTWE